MPRNELTFIHVFLTRGKIIIYTFIFLFYLQFLFTTDTAGHPAIAGGQQPFRDGHQNNVPNNHHLPATVVATGPKQSV